MSNMWLHCLWATSGKWCNIIFYGDKHLNEMIHRLIAAEGQEFSHDDLPALIYLTGSTKGIPVIFKLAQLTTNKDDTTNTLDMNSKPIISTVMPPIVDSESSVGFALMFTSTPPSNHLQCLCTWVNFTEG